MKIALSTSVIQRGRSGVGQYALALIRALLPAASHHEFTLFALEEDLPLLDFARGRMRLEAVSERYRPPLKNILWHQAVLPGVIRRMGIEVLHVPSYRRMLWPRPCALVATIHDLAPFRVPQKYDWSRMIYGRIVARRLAARQDALIAVSTDTSRDITRFFGPAMPEITVVPNGLDHDRFRPGSAPAAKAAVCRPRGLAFPFFLYVARLEHPAKNHVGLVHAFSRFKAESGSTWHLVLAGSDWHGAEEIHRAIAASPYRQAIHCPGFVPQADLPRWYQAADVFVYPSRHEGFGLPPLEAMACGCPVLSSAKGALAEVIGSAAGLLEPDDILQIQRQLARAAADWDWRERMRQAGLDQSARFDWQCAAKATVDVYARAHSTAARQRGIRLNDRPWNVAAGKTSNRSVFTQA